SAVLASGRVNKNGPWGDFANKVSTLPSAVPAMVAMNKGRLTKMPKNFQDCATSLGSDSSMSGKNKQIPAVISGGYQPQDRSSNQICAALGDENGCSAGFRHVASLSINRLHSRQS